MKLASALLFTAALSAADPLVGTWSANFDKSPGARVSISKFDRDGEFLRNDNGQVNYKFKIDGKEYPVPSGPQIDTAIWRKTGPRKFEHEAKKGGKLSYTVVTEVAVDGKTRTYQHTLQLDNGKNAAYDTVQDRVGGETDPANPLIGHWRMRQAIEWKQAGNEFHFKSGPTTWSAAPDGKDYPVAGSNNMDAVSLRRLSPNSIETTAKKAGKVVFTATHTVSADGKSLTVTFSKRGTVVYDRVTGI